MQDGSATGGGGVGDHEAAESPVALQNVREEPAILGSGQPIDRVVGGHDGPRAGIPDCGLERREMQLVELPHAQVYWIAVTTAVANVGDEVFRRGHDARAFE